MKKYDLVIERTLEELVKVTNEAIDHGYYPKGGMTEYGGKFIQTIYLREKEYGIYNGEIEIIKVDVDGTILVDAWPKLGVPMPGAIETLLKLQAAGHNLILWTCREGQNLIDVIEFLKSKGITFEAINENHPASPFKDEPIISRKPYAHRHIDDKNFGGFPGWKAVHDFYFPYGSNPLEATKAPI